MAQNGCGIEKIWKYTAYGTSGCNVFGANVNPVLILLLHSPSNFMLFVRFLEFSNSWKFYRSNVWFMKHNIALKKKESEDTGSFWVESNSQLGWFQVSFGSHAGLNKKATAAFHKNKSLSLLFISSTYYFYHIHIFIFCFWKAQGQNDTPLPLISLWLSNINLPL